MSIRPIDLQQMIPKSQEASQIRANEQQKVANDQTQFHEKFNQAVKHNSQQITKSQETENSEYRYDAREKGSNSYSKQKGKKKKQDKDKSNEDKNDKIKTSTFDMKI